MRFVKPFHCMTSSNDFMKCAMEKMEPMGRKKKAAALMVSILFYIGTFLLLFRFTMGEQIRWFFCGFPILIASYFITVGTVFSKILGLNRWILWLSMNFVGGVCSWVILILCLPALLMNGMLLLLVGILTVLFAMVWAVIGLGFLCVKWFQRRSR